MSIDFEAEGLLEGLGDQERQARLELLEELAGDGVPLEELRQAVAEDRLALLPVERVLTAEGQLYSAQEVAERSGADLDAVLRLWEALGLSRPEPDDEVFTDEDVEAARRLVLFQELGLPEEGIQEVSRALALHMPHIVQATQEVFTRALMRPGDTERDLGLRYAAGARELTPQVGPMLEYVYALHLRESVRRGVVGRADLAAGTPGAREVAICFADLVGFTVLGEGLAPDELVVVAGRLSELAAEVARPPVRLVKMIGDAAMLVAPEAKPLLDAGLALVDAAETEGEGFPLLRAGAAWGTALMRGGDWYGRPVNLASRITSIARPGSLLASASLKDQADGGYRYSFAGKRRLKGISEEVDLFRVRREPKPAADS